MLLTLRHSGNVRRLRSPDCELAHDGAHGTAYTFVDKR